MKNNIALTVINLLALSCGQNKESQNTVAGSFQVEAIDVRLDLYSDTEGVSPMEAWLVRSRAFPNGYVTVKLENTGERELCFNTFRGSIGAINVMMDFGIMKFPDPFMTRLGTSCISPKETSYIGGYLASPYVANQTETLSVALNRHYAAELNLVENKERLLLQNRGLYYGESKLEGNIFTISLKNESLSSRYFYTSEPSLGISRMEGNKEQIVMIVRGQYLAEQPSIIEVPAGTDAVVNIELPRNFELPDGYSIRPAFTHTGGKGAIDD